MFSLLAQKVSVLHRWFQPHFIFAANSSGVPNIFLNVNPTSLAAATGK